MKLKPFKLYESSIPSGNAYKVLLLASHLNIDLKVERLNILSSPSQTRTPEFLKKNPNGRIPVLELSNGSYLWESNAILFYLAESTEYLPTQPLERARTLQWMFFEQYSHEPFVAVLKFWKFFGGGLDRCEPKDVSLWLSRGQRALGVMNTHLRDHEFFSGGKLGVADIALYAYTHTASATGYNLGALAPLRQWLQRVASHARHVPVWGGPGSVVADDL